MHPSVLLALGVYASGLLGVSGCEQLIAHHPDSFGFAVALSASGDTIAVESDYERSASTDIDGDQQDNSALASRAPYVFLRTDAAWQQQTYIKPFSTNTGDPNDDTATSSGAVYVFH